VRKSALNYAAALAAVLIAVLLRWLADPMLGDRVPLITMFGGVAAAAWIGGLGPATLAMVVGYLLCQFLFVAPRGTLAHLTGPDLIALVAYLVTCVLIISMGESFRVYRTRFEEVERKQGGDPTRQPSSEYIRYKYTRWDSLLVAFAVSLAVLLIGGLTGYRNADRLARIQDRVARTHEDIREMAVLLSAVKDAETGQRGYLLTGDSSYLDPFYRGKQEIPAVLDQLQGFLSDTGQIRRLAEARQLTSSKLTELEHTVSLAESGKRAAALAIVRSDSGQWVMQQLRTVVGTMQDTARALLERRSAESRESFRLTVLSILITGGLGVVLVGGLFLLAQRRLRERHQAAVVLAEQRERLRVTLASIGDAVITTDLDSRITSINAVAQRLTGWTEAEACGQDLTAVFRIVNEETREPVENPAIRALRDGVIVGLANHTVLISRDGTEVPIDDSAAPIRDEEGTLTGCVLIYRDISQRRRLERESAGRAAAAAFAASLVESSEDAILAVSLDGRIQTWNGAAERLYGYSAAEAVGQSINFLIPEDRADEEDQLVRRLLAGERISHFETIRRRKDGSLVDVSLTISTVRDEKERIIGTSKIVRDNSHAKAAEARIFALMADLKDADRRKDEFLAILAHELRGPLAPIRHLLEIIKRTDGDRAALRDATVMMDRQLDQIVRLVDDLLDVSRITRNKLELRRERVDLIEILKQSLELNRPLAESARHQVTVTLADEPLYLHGDAVRLSQVLTNLLQNAFKYTEPGGHIWVSAERQGSEVRVAVKDTGAGIPADVLPRIFDLFIQVDRTLERSQGGLGIGLTLVKQLVMMHEGTVEAMSEGPGRGSQFVVRLPLLVEQREARHPGRAGTPEDQGSPRRILVVDDNQDSADSLAVLLRMLGHEAHVAYDGQEAVEVAKEVRPEVIMLDIGLPRMNGYEACRTIREQPWGKRITIIAISGWGQDTDRQKSEAAGFDHHMVKPVDYTFLRQVLASLPSDRGSPS
jgi:PAS domain S-box-containing protein